MSVYSQIFLIIGCDVKDFVTEKYKEWRDSEEGERYTEYQTEEEMQFIEDGMCGMYNYFGYIISNIEDFYGECTKELSNDVFNKRDDIIAELRKLVDIGVLKEDVLNEEMKLILFNHCT